MIPSKFCTRFRAIAYSLIKTNDFKKSNAEIENLFREFNIEEKQKTL